MSLSKGLGYAGQGAAIGATMGGPLGAGIGGVAGLIGGLFSDDGSEEAAAKLQAAVDAINELQIPELDKAIAIQQFQQSGTLSPELMDKLQLEADKKTVLTEDPQNRANQQMALNALKELSQTGLSAIDRAAMMELRSQVAQDEQAKQQQILQEAQQRGQAGGGAQIAAQLSSSQAGAQGAAKAAMQQGAAAAQARQNALAQFGNMAGQVRSADVGTQQFNLQNELARQRFLDQNSLSRQQYNVGAMNQARQMNLQRQQQVSDINTQAANQELARQKEAQWQMFQGELAKRKAVAGLYGDQAGFELGQAAAEAGGIGKMFSGLGQFAGAGKDLGWWGAKSDNTSDKTNTSDTIKPIKIKKTTKLPASTSYDFARAAHGGRISGEANVDGDSYKNDIVPTLLSPDEIVVPRSKAKDPQKAKSFIDEIFEQEKLDKKQKKGYDRNESLLDLIAKLHGEKSK